MDSKLNEFKNDIMNDVSPNYLENKYPNYIKTYPCFYETCKQMKENIMNTNRLKSAIYLYYGNVEKIIENKISKYGSMNKYVVIIESKYIAASDNKIKLFRNIENSHMKKFDDFPNDVTLLWKDYNGEPIIVLYINVRNLDYRSFLSIFENYPIKTKIKNDNIYSCARYLFIVSNKTPACWFSINTEIKKFLNMMDYTRVYL